LSIYNWSIIIRRFRAAPNLIKNNYHSTFALKLTLFGLIAAIFELILSLGYKAGFGISSL